MPRNGPKPDLYEAFGKSQTLKEWARDYNMSVSLIRLRLRNDMKMEQALLMPLKMPKLYRHNDKEMTLSEWDREYGLSKGALSKRMKKGMSFEEALAYRIDRQLYTAFGKSLTLHAWARESGIDHRTLRHRVKEGGMTLEDAINKPINRPDKYYCLTNGGESKLLTQWADEYGISPGALYQRIMKGETLEIALTREVDTSRSVHYTIEGKSHTLAEWAHEKGIPYHALLGRLELGWELKDALEKPVIHSRRYSPDRKK